MPAFLQSIAKKIGIVREQEKVVPMTKLPVVHDVGVSIVTIPVVLTS